MDSIYIVIVLVLLALAALDLVVGVANDAVNFLNSSIGSRVAPLWVILTVASVGVIIGSLFSTGMMEIARSGVFYPEKFTFASIMMLFLAVMITDVILLDVFNTFGLPTSTTVSLVFELLGAAVAVSLFTIWQNNEVVDLAQYINTGKALKIISGIFISILISFAVGSAIMYISRIIFSFNYHKSFQYLGAIWGGIALTAIAYFAILKGLKSTTLISKESIQYLNDHTAIILLYTFLGMTALMALLQHLFKIKILKIIILSGTAALALSFAGNDLVNFIGVFMAGLSSYQFAGEFVAQGGNLDNLYMSRLSEAVNVDWRYLFGAGVIMVLSLWFNKKSRSVTKTEVNLSRQGEGLEQFSSSGASRSLVRNALNIGRFIDYITPQKVKYFIESRFKPLEKKEPNSPSFDMIRASVNLTVAAMLISLGTSLKLPLSTTYVTFMVAMGSSLADRAWGRESAVYRITGVLTVISGWFLTAVVAFTVSAIIAFALMYGGIYAVIGLLLLVVLLIIQFTLVHKKRIAKEEAKETSADIKSESDLIQVCSNEMEEAIETTIRIYRETLDGLFNEDRKKLNQLHKEADSLYRKYKNRRHYEVVPTLKRLENAPVEVGQFYIQVIDYFYEISKSLKVMTESSFKYIDDNHEGFSKEQINDLTKLSEQVIEVASDFVSMIQSWDYSRFDNLLEKRHLIADYYALATRNQIKRAKSKDSGTRNSILFLSLLNETKIIALQSSNLMKSQKRLVKMKQKKE
ncbi:MAG: inorganic phosphate transporter [Paludibacter sp.]|jgi:phosphate/sulfate permease|nr:inorganic phosphate transporter [Paludibacter sp.]